MSLDARYQRFHDDLLTCLPADRLITDPLRTFAYGTDASFYRLVPKIVVRIEAEAEIVALLHLAREQQIPVTFRAAGTSLSGQAISDSVLVILGDSWRGHQILQDGAQIRLQPGVIGQWANDWLKPYQRKIGPDPASINAAKIGGIVANNSSGMCCGTAQNTYHTLASVRVVLADGAVLDTGDADSVAAFRVSHREMLAQLSALAEATRANAALAHKIRHKYRLKNTTGYALNALTDFEDPIEILAHLLVGSEGTLGFISEVTYHTVEDHPHKASTLVVFPDAYTCCEAVAALKSTPVSAVELMDGRGMRSVRGKPGLPAFIDHLDIAACSLLVETRAATSLALTANRQEIEAVLAQFTMLERVPFTTVEAEYSKLWAVRKGLFPAVGAVRETGTTVIIEDVAFQVADLAAGVQKLQALFERFGYDEALIFGHALEGNLHFVFTQGFDSPEEIQRYSQFMDAVAQLVAVEYGGSLKAEHGTGRNMAPYIELEWGAEGYALMQDIKRLFDPRGVLNPDVIIAADHSIHLKNLKAMPAAHPIVDKCIECGFCEPACPSRDLSLSPRQRITVWREIQALQRSGQEPARLARLKQDYDWMGVETCAATGLCQQNCPVGINTGDLIRAIRADAAVSTEGQAQWAAAHVSGIGKVVQWGLGIANFAHTSLGSDTMQTLADGARRLSGGAVPHWSPALPRPAAHWRVPQRQTGEAVVYLPSCVSRNLGPAEGDTEEVSLMDKTVSVLEQAGYRVIFPDELNQQCCGQPFESKGHFAAADAKKRQLEAVLLKASEYGRYPIYVDTSPCALRLLSGLDARLKVYDSVAFLAEKVIDRLRLQPVDASLAVHLTCSVRKMGLSEAFLKVARAIAREVKVPEHIGCCGFAGDKGFHTPELNAHALRDLKAQVSSCDSGISSSRTCEIGLSEHSGLTYRSLIYVLDRAIVRT